MVSRPTLRCVSKSRPAVGPLCVKLSQKKVVIPCQILRHPAARVKVPAAPCVKVSESVKFRPAPAGAPSPTVLSR